MSRGGVHCSYNECMQILIIIIYYYGGYFVESKTVLKMSRKCLHTVISVCVVAKDNGIQAVYGKHTLL